MTRLGLCCLFRDQPIKFVTTTATSIDNWLVRLSDDLIEEIKAQRDLLAAEAGDLTVQVDSPLDAMVYSHMG